MGSSFRRFFKGASSRQAVPYPDPYVDIATFNIPPSIKSLMILCRRIFLTHSTVYPTIWKYSSYPITDIRVEAATDNIKNDWTVLSEKVLKLKYFDMLLGLDYFAYGNAMASMVFPFDKYLICPECNFEQRARGATYKFNATGQWDFRGVCPACKKAQAFIAEDREVKHAYNRLKLIRWPPLSIDIDYNPYTEDTEYYHRIPRMVRDKLAAGSKLLAATLPKEFITAAKLGKRIRLERDNFFHMKRPSISDSRLSFSPWGLPLILPVIKDAYWMQILRKAEEASAMNRILPLRWIFPTEQNQAQFSGHNLGLVRSRIEAEVKKWIRDPNYIAIAPSQIGSNTVGADARPMLLNNEIRAAAELIVSGMGVPREFVFGGLSYSGSSISIRMIENEMMGYRAFINEFNDGFVRQRAQTYLDWPEATYKLANLRMADDVQLKQFLANANAAGKLSDDDWMQELGFDASQQRKKRREEMEYEREMNEYTQLANAELQGKMMVIQSKYQVEAQVAQQEIQKEYNKLITTDPEAMKQINQGQLAPGITNEPTDQEAMEGDLQYGGGGQVVPIQKMLNAHAQQLSQMDPTQRQHTLAQMQQTMPSTANEVRKMLGAQGTLNQADTRPLPEQLPPRRTDSP